VSSRGTSSIVKSGIHVALSNVSVDSEFSRGGGSLSSEKSLSDEDILSDS